MHWGSPSYYRCLHCQQLAIFAETIRFATLLLVMESCSSLSQMPKQTETIKHWSVLLVIQYWHCWNPCDGPGCQFAKILPGGFSQLHHCLIHEYYSCIRQWALGHIGSGDNCQGFSRRYFVVSSSQCSDAGQVQQLMVKLGQRSKEGDLII